ncbi:MAG: hypothetical protein HZA81_00240 [Candidatus Taylorbacteria bacterium]|nr:hypothetical protein [Candidatus Taylorbacteria bacterium]
MDTRGSLEDAIEAGRQGKIEEWVQAFLQLEEKNQGLSEGLKKANRWWSGPLEIAFSRLPRITGPEVGMEYRIDPLGWERKTLNMVRDIKGGWTPAPLIAEYRSGELSLRDGNHRREALEKAGRDRYWTVVWFNSEADKLSFDAL